ncbi:dystroglycan-like [Dorcoceras hygrometricum]|uniref:Dystroglycan-like n=1 Tax=Dorcoceras hygrometricum TaxID=472368 RepID=A0A2Z7D8X4_9LAMI|nr:dystroglycan-like [Dorcoceras hygrometricum]
MAASFYSNSVHVDFESALAMGEPGMVSMFQALIASGLQGFLGCTAVVYEDALVEFLANGIVRDGLVVSTVNGVAIEFSEKLFTETFDLPVDGLADISEMPKDKIFDARSIVYLTREPVTLSGLKIQMKMHYRLLCDIMAKSVSVKAGSFNTITVEKFSFLTAVVCDVKMNWGSVLFGILKKMVTPGTKQAQGFAIQISLLLESVPNLELGESSEFPSSKILTDKTIHRYIAVIDKSGAQEPADAPKVKKAPRTKVASKKRPADIPLYVPVVKRKRTSKKKSTLKLVTVAQEAIPIQTVPAELAVEPMVEDQQAETEDAADQPAAEEETLADRPADEIVNVEQRVDESAVEVSRVDVVDPDIVIQQVLNQLDFSTEGQDVTKGDRVETWFDRALAEEIATAGDDSPTEKGNDEIPWFVRPFLSADHDSERLFETRSDSAAAMDFEVHSQNLPVVKDTYVDPAGSPRDRGAVIARSNTNTPSKCWIRTMIYVDGVWTVEPCDDRWVKIPRQVISSEVHRQRQYDDTLPPVNIFYKTLTKRWADICFEVVDSCASRRLLPVGSLQFCQSLLVVEPGYRVAPCQSSVFAFRVSQFCSVFVDFSVFSWLPTTDITDFLSSIALERTVLRNVQRSVSVVHPNVQFLDQHISSPTSSEDSSMNFDNTDIDATATAPAFSLPGSSTVSLYITRAVNQLQASLDQISHRDDGAAFKDTILMHLRDIEKEFTARFDAQDRWIGALRNDSNDQRNLLSLEFKSSHRQLHTQIAAASIDQIDMQREMKELNAKVDAIATNMERVKRDAEATKEAILHQLFEFQSQAQDDHIILTTQLGQLIEDLNRGGNDKKGEGVSSRGPQPTRAHVPVRVERRPLPTREPSPDAQSSGQYLSAEQAAEFKSVVEFYKGPVGGKTQYAYQQSSLSVEIFKKLTRLEEHLLLIFKDKYSSHSLVHFIESSFFVLETREFYRTHVYSLLYLIESVKNWLCEAVQKHLFDTCNQQLSLPVELVSLGVHTSAACVGGCLQRSCNHQSLLVIHSEAEEGET